ncbi:PhnD/SsuA/transferrin family substrate-binding protein [Demequina litorisediminis]|uniref:PhnD/SsuA/transferrin family substrate-binding protein n=1 Tax=Demequina litorisediminis TaxID=1849022 RepID=UPI0024E0A237|nr:PhnD/SsuA/transferrin family substrate-binding protein [Demequina litorisediminis]
MRAVAPTPTRTPPPTLPPLRPGSEAAAAGADWPEEITLALIPNENVTDLVTTVAPLTDYLSEQLGITVEGVVTQDYQAAVEAIGSGQAQIAIADAGSLAAAEDMYGAHAVLQDVRFGASSYAAMAFTNNPDKYCEDEPVEATYAATGQTFLYCNGTASGEENTGVGPVAMDALAKIEPGTTVAFGNTTSPAGYQPSRPRPRGQRRQHRRPAAGACDGQ